MTTDTQLTATVEELIDWSPCEEWPEERIRDAAGDRDPWTALDVLAMEDVPAADRLWVVLRKELIPTPILHELACRFADEVLPIYERKHPDDSRPRAAIAAKRAWMRGELSDTELRMAWASAAAEAAASAAASAASEAAAAAAADAEAWADAEAGAAAAARAAARAGARQIEIVRELLEASGPGGE